MAQGNFFTNFGTHLGSGWEKVKGGDFFGDNGLDLKETGALAATGAGVLIALWMAFNFFKSLIQDLWEEAGPIIMLIGAALLAGLAYMGISRYMAGNDKERDSGTPVSGDARTIDDKIAPEELTRGTKVNELALSDTVNLGDLGRLFSRRENRPYIDTKGDKNVLNDEFKVPFDRLPPALQEELKGRGA